MNDGGIASTMADIALPAPPDWRPVIVAAVLALVALAALAGRARRRARRRSPARATAGAIARLERLERDWTERTLDDREAGYRLAALLRIGLGLPQLSADRPPGRAAVDAREWAATVALLQRLRYRRRPDSGLSPAVFARAREWLAEAETAQGGAT